jgi:hypothetical protein
MDMLICLDVSVICLCTLRIYLKITFYALNIYLYNFTYQVYFNEVGGKTRKTKELESNSPLFESWEPMEHRKSNVCVLRTIIV